MNPEYRNMGAPSIDQSVFNNRFPLTRTDWDFNIAEGKKHLKVYRQAPLAGLTTT